MIHKTLSIIGWILYSAKPSIPRPMEGWVPTKHLLDWFESSAGVQNSSLGRMYHVIVIRTMPFSALSQATNISMSDSGNSATFGTSYFET